MSVSGNTKTVAITQDGKQLTIHSDYQQYNKKQNSYIGNGHVKIWFDDYYAQGPKVSVFPDLETGKPNESLMIKISLNLNCRKLLNGRCLTYNLIQSASIF